MQQPPMPPSAPEKSPWTKLALIFVIGVVALAIISTDKGSATPTRETYHPTTSTVVDDTITAAMVVDAMQESQRQEFCTAYFTLNDYDLGLQFFSRHYDVPDPSAEEVFDELLSRC